MPIYEYECASCKTGFEELQLRRDAETPACPTCERPDHVSRRISASSFVLKGGGWYKDLYASPKTTGEKGGGQKGGDAPAKGGSTEAA